MHHPLLVSFVTPHAYSCSCRCLWLQYGFGEGQCFGSEGNILQSKPVLIPHLSDYHVLWVDASAQMAGCIALRKKDIEKHKTDGEGGLIAGRCCCCGWTCHHYCLLLRSSSSSFFTFIWCPFTGKATQVPLPSWYNAEWPLQRTCLLAWGNQGSYFFGEEELSTSPNVVEEFESKDPVKLFLGNRVTTTSSLTLYALTREGDVYTVGNKTSSGDSKSNENLQSH